MTRRSTAPPCISAGFECSSRTAPGPRSSFNLRSSARIFSIAYLARLFLGSLKERDGHFDEAEALYRDAGRRVPYGQAAPLALAQLLSRTGRDAEARETLAENVLRRGSPVVEPMWAYGPPSEDPVTQIDIMRMEVWK